MAILVMFTRSGNTGAVIYSLHGETVMLRTLVTVA